MINALAYATAARGYVLQKKSPFIHALQTLAKLPPTPGKKIRRFGITMPAMSQPELLGPSQKPKSLILRDPRLGTATT